MILLIFFAVGLLFFAFCYFQESGLFKGKHMMRFDAVLIDEVEDEVFDNTGGSKTRFFKAYEFNENGENKVVRSERPMRHITNNVGKKCIIYVDSKNRKAMEKSDITRYRIIASVLILMAILCVGLYFTLPIFVPEVAI